MEIASKADPVGAHIGIINIPEFRAIASLRLSGFLAAAHSDQVMQFKADNRHSEKIRDGCWGM